MRIHSDFRACLYKVVPGLAFALLALSTQAQQENGARPPVAPSASSPDQSTEDPALRAAMRQKDWPRALQLLDIRLAAQPNEALSHYRRGEVLTQLDRREDALLAFERSVQLAPRAKLAWIELCWQQILAGRPGQARAACERSVALEKTSISTLNLGHIHLLQGDAETAQQWYRETLGLLESPQQLGDGPLADFDLFIARGWRVEEARRARQWFVSGWPQWQRMRKLTDQVTRLFEEGQYIAARNAAQESLGLSEQLFGPDHPATGVSTNGLAQINRAMGEPAQALPLQQRALAIAEKTLEAEHPVIGTLLNNLALIYQSMGEFDRALSLSRRALTITEKAQGSAHPDTGLRLNNLAFIHKDKGEFAQALPLFQRALAISEKADGAEHPATSMRLNNLALLYKDMGEYAQALPLLQRSLAICEKTLGPEHPSTGKTLNNLGKVYEHMGQYAQALLLIQRALAIAEKALGAEHPDTSILLSNLAYLHQKTGQHGQALPLFRRALAITEKVQGAEHPDTSGGLSNLAELHRDMGQAAQALPFAQRAVAIAEKALGADHPITGVRLNNLALTYHALGRFSEALPLFQRALAISEKTEGTEHPSTGMKLNNLAGYYRTIGPVAQALPLYLRALRIAESSNSAELIWNVQGNLMLLLAEPQPDAPELHHPALAIWFGKQAVNTLQRVRAGLKSLDHQTQQSFLKENEWPYTFLANRLIEAGRLAEAEQVLAMLKEYELTQLLRSRAETTPPAQVSHVGAERQAHDENQHLVAEGVRQSTEMAALRRKDELSSTEQARLDALEKASAVWRTDYERFLVDLGQRFAREGRRDATRLSDQQRTRLQDNVALDPAGGVGLHYSVSDSGIGIIVATPGGSFGRFRAVKRDDLNRQIVGLRQAILDHADTRPAAQALWQMLIAPVQADLQASGARTLVLSLTDTLRYLPFAALQDPQGRYLMQDYALSLWAAAARDIDPRPDRRDWQIAGFGVTHAHPGYTALPAVRTELHSIVRTDTNPVGLLPGRIALDEAFSLEQFNATLRGRTNVLHVASHFTFRPGDEHGSGLLLGNGRLLSLAELATKDFSRLDQFTLSACNTATGGGVNENGAEVEGLAATVLREGRARAVMATLWKVADDSTAQLMRSFYTLRAQAQPLSRAQALRQAQLAMLEGAPRPNPASSGTPDADRQASRPGRPAPDTGVQPIDPARPFAHPYFWAPFVLTGSWL